MKSSVFVLTAALLLGCAKSNYAVAGGAGGDVSPPNSQTTTAQCPNYFSKAGMCFSLTWVDGIPAISKEGHFILRFWPPNADQSTLVDPAAEVAVVLWMSSHGHGSLPVQISKTGSGEYLVNKVFFVMAGPWDIRVQLKNGQTILEQVVVPVTIQ